MTAVRSSERIRVMLLLPSLHGGGAERMALHVLQHADRARFDVRMGLLRLSGELGSQVDPSLVDVAPVGRRFLDFDQGNAAAYRNAIGLPLAPYNVVSMMRRFRPHVVMSFRKGMSVCTMAAVTIYGRHRVRWIAREGNNTLAVVQDELQSELARRAVTRLTGACYGSADRLLTITYEMARALERDLGLDPARVTTIHNAVDVAEVRRRAAVALPAPPPEPFLLGVGRLERQKGFDVLLRAYAAGTARHRARLVLLGDGSERDALEALARELGVADRVSMPGFTDNPWAYMARSVAFVLSSRWEGFGMVVAEAMAAGAPVVVTDCDFGPKEIVRDGESGLVVPTDDMAALRDAIDRVTSSADVRARLVAGGNARADDFDVHTIVRRYEALFAELFESLPERHRA